MKVRREILRREYKEFKKRNPGLCIWAICEENGYTGQYLSTAALKKNEYMEETTLEDCRALMQEAEKHPEKYKKKYQEWPQSYAIYKGDKLIGIGSARELADKLGISEKSIRFYGTPSYRRRTEGSNKAFRLIPIKEGE